MIITIFDEINNADVCEVFENLAIAILISRIYDARRNEFKILS
jgi:hypothetical protein